MSKTEAKSIPGGQFAVLCATMIFVGAFLLFQVQPIISKMILPWFGGSPAVWTTCMLFFQVFLLAGYTYAHLLTRLTSPSRQAMIHGTLLLISLITLPITPEASWKPEDGENPAGRILWLLMGNVGLTYLLLAATSPLVQSWFARVYPDRSPYRLYALSNIGSLGALLTYPFLVEPALTTTSQGNLWSGVFFLFAAVGVVVAISLRTYRSFPAASAGEVERESHPVRQNAHQPPKRKRKKGRTQRSEQPGTVATGASFIDQLPSLPPVLVWLLLPAFASVMLLAVTNHLSQNVAVVPFLWIAPLSLYLVSFIICFDKEAWYSGRWYGLGGIASVLGVAYLMVAKYLRNLQYEMSLTGGGEPAYDSLVQRLMNSAIFQTSMYLAFLFFICMICHGELTRRKPEASKLTSFYLTVSAGGAIGGIFVAILCPLLLSSYLELNIGLIIGFVLSVMFFVIDARDRWLSTWSALLRRTCFVAAVVCLVFVTWAQYDNVTYYYHGLAVKRNFYGVLSVRDHFVGEPGHGRSMYHGTIIHGYQYLSEERKAVPTTYYSRLGGGGLALEELGKEGSLRVGVIGLGVGTLATYQRPGDVYRMYEINPLVIEFAKDYFTFLDLPSTAPELVSGDARLSLEREAPQEFDVLILDAFSGDAVPVHLLTQEAMDVYLRHVKPGGIIAAHISNRYLDLVPVIAELSHHHKLACTLIDENTVGEESHRLALTPSLWALMSRDPEVLQQGELAVRSVPAQRTHGFPLWTDQYNNLFQILR